MRAPPHRSSAADTARALRACAAPILVWLTAACAPAAVAAQACCATTATNEFAIVGREHHAIFVADLAYQPGLTTRDAEGTVGRLGEPGYFDVVIRVGAGVRLPWRPLQISGLLPLRLQSREFGEQPTRRRAGIGDAAFSLRYTVLKDTTHGIHGGMPRSYLPFLDLFASAKVPTARGPADGQDPVGADVMGNGQWALGFGLKVSKHVRSDHVVQLIAQQLLRRPRELPQGPSGSPPGEFSLGDLTQLQLGYIRIESIFWSWGLAAVFQHTARSRVREPGDRFRQVPDSDVRRLQLGAFITHALRFPRLDLSLGLSFDPPIDGLAKNLVAVGPTLALKLGYNIVEPFY